MVFDFNLLTNAKRIACIGTSSPTINNFKLCQIIGYSLAKMNKEIASGNCIGSDQSYATGTNEVDESLVYLNLIGHNHNNYAIKPNNHLVYSDDHPEWISIAKKIIQNIIIYHLMSKN